MPEEKGKGEKVLPGSVRALSWRGSHVPTGVPGDLGRAGYEQYQGEPYEAKCEAHLFL